VNDPYETLGVDRSATDDEIKRAYRDLARRHHPDSNPGDPHAEERFKEIGAAYEVLRDPERRRRFDRFGDTGGGGGPAGGDPFSGFGDLFDAFFGGDPFGARGRAGGPVRGDDAETVIELSLTEAAFGATHTLAARLPVECPRCTGNGCEPGTFPSRCDACGGQGEVRQVRRSILGQIMTSAPCGACSGTGRRILTACRDCRGDGRVMSARTIDVDVPAGVDDGTRLRLNGRGAAAPRGGPPGDLYVTIRVAPHPGFERRGDDLVATVPLGIAQAVLGTELSVEGLDATHEVTVPAGTQPGQMFRVKGAGIPSLRSRGRGDLLVRVEIEIPTRLDDHEAELFHRLAEHRGETVAPPSKGVFARLRSAFQ
jgi:molecular chaperone DnaJ